MIMNQEQIDFFQQLGLKTDWRGAIYGKTESNEETACGTSEGQSEVEKEA